MRIFVDTSALLAVVDADDDFHVTARGEWASLLDQGAGLLSTNYVLLESTAFLRRRLGMEAVRLFVGDVVPAFEITWIASELHDLAVSSLIAANRRQLSLVDLTSFSVMRASHIDTAFTFDQHFAEQGFSVVPRA